MEQKNDIESSISTKVEMEELPKKPKPQVSDLISGATLPEAFVDRQRFQGLENRKTIKVLSQSADEILADITDIPFEEGEAAGTNVDKALMNNLRAVIDQADRNATSAYQKADYAEYEAERGAIMANNACVNADKAKEDSAMAVSLAMQLKEQVIDKQGTKVTANGQYLETFDADQKADRSELTQYLRLDGGQIQGDIKAQGNFTFDKTINVRAINLITD